MRTVSCALVLGLGLLQGTGARALQVTRVTHGPRTVHALSLEAVAIRFRLSDPARVEVRVHDVRDLRIRTLASDGVLPAGDHRIAWDGTDYAGRPAPAGAYTYSIEAVSKADERVEWDLTDQTGGDLVEPHELRWDPTKGVVSYDLRKASRIRIRLGLENGGPLLRTLIDWVPRGPGRHEERWDGKDASGVLELGDHPSLAIVARAFSLSRNTILVLPASAQVNLIPDVPRDTPQRVSRVAHPKRMLDYPRQSVESRRDFPLRLVLPPDLDRTAQGLPIVRGPLPVRLEVAEADLASALNERCEAVFYVDGRYVFENEVGFLPMTWTWHPTGTNPGVHYISANLRGYEGHFGMATISVYVERTGGAK